MTIILLAIAFWFTTLRPEPDFDIILRNGMVVDGSGVPGVRTDVAIQDGKIVKVGNLSEAKAKRVIDASGLIVAPGFIDVHTHADDLAENPRAENYLRMGVTTVVAGNCGSSALEIGKALSGIRQAGPSINYATLIGHNTVREAVMGEERRAPTPAEMEKMKALVAQGMKEGAVGFSSGLQYTPGTWADPSEITELARVACAAGGLYASHMRNEGTEIEKSVAETIAVGESAGCRVEISHLKIDSPRNWGMSAKALALIDSARSRGVDVHADQYAYTAAASSLSIRFPDWVLEGGQEEVRKRLDDPATWAKIRDGMKELLAARGFQDLSFAVVSSYPPDPSLQGLSMKEVAIRLKGNGSADAQFEAARDMLRAGGAGMVYHLMSEDDVATILRHSQVAVASDGSLPVFGKDATHPRAYGNNARVLGLYVREKKAIPLEEAIRKMTSLPAAHFKLSGRGLVKEGYAADLVLFDPAKVGDAATFEKPHAYAMGFPYVLVNGVPVIDGGTHTGAKAGHADAD
ncbi:MAG: N-acyl-D-amino-acid deacylase [Acidobacteriota bacterium]|nr:N-acyl-D-amino-acid deacylase [Acidobacteriota bacterium]